MVFSSLRAFANSQSEELRSSDTAWLEISAVLGLELKLALTRYSQSVTPSVIIGSRGGAAGALRAIF